MSKTPRTDAHCQQIIDDALGLEYAATELQYWAEKLEEELAAAQDEIKRLRGKCAAIEGNEIGYPCVALSEAQAQRDEMKLALRDLTDAFADYGGPKYSNVYKNALKALGWDAAIQECGK